NQSKPIYVNTKFFDTSEQTFAVLGYFRVRWIDETMVWKPKYWNYINTVKPRFDPYRAHVGAQMGSTWVPYQLLAGLAKGRR
ncbi:hypothetical protein DPMN_140436, partial [Dreissena polymorpha]